MMLSRKYKNVLNENILFVVYRISTKNKLDPLYAKPPQRVTGQIDLNKVNLKLQFINVTSFRNIGVCRMSQLNRRAV